MFSNLEEVRCTLRWGDITCINRSGILITGKDDMENDTIRICSVTAAPEKSL
jgi:hypothetical protein